MRNSTENSSPQPTDSLRRLLSAFTAPQVDGSKNEWAAWLTLIVGAVIAGFLFFANGLMHPYEEYHIVNYVLLLWIPLICILSFTRYSPADFGMAVGDRKFGLILTLAGLAIMAPIAFVMAHHPEFRGYYLQRLGQPLAITNWTTPQPGMSMAITRLIYYELTMGCYFFCWEFYFRGFLLFGLAKSRFVGPWTAILLQTIPFVILHWSLVPGASKPPIEIFGAALGGPLLGYLALRTRSFYYGFLIHWLMAMVLDLAVFLSVAPM